MEHVSYIRVSSIDQNEDRQIAELKKKGVRADKQFTDKASGSSTDRPQLKAMLDYVREGDYIHVWSIDRLARNIEDLNNLVKKVVKMGCIITFHKEGLTFGNGEDDATSSLLFNILGSFAQFERALIKERQAEGIAAAKAKGKHMGRPSKLTEEQKQEIVEKRGQGMNPTQLAKEYGVSRASIYDICTKEV